MPNVVTLTEHVAKAVASMPKAAEALFGKRGYAPVLGGHSVAVKETSRHAVASVLENRTVDMALAWMDKT